MKINRKHTRKVAAFCITTNSLKTLSFYTHLPVTTPPHPIRGSGHG